MAEISRLLNLKRKSPVCTLRGLCAREGGDEQKIILSICNICNRNGHYYLRNRGWGGGMQCIKI